MMLQWSNVLESVKNAGEGEGSYVHSVLAYVCVSVWGGRVEHIWWGNEGIWI